MFNSILSLSPISLLFSSPIVFAAMAVALLLALSVHEAAHAFVSNLLGDDTAEKMGRLTLNPLSHLDPIGLILLLLVGFGWGKPVMVNPHNFKNPIRDEILTALAGPASNLLLAILVAIIYFFIKPYASAPLQTLFIYTGFYNLILMLFNLIPLPPLDGSKVLYLFIPYATIEFINQYSLYILLALIFIPVGGYRIIDIIIFDPAIKLFSLLFHINPFI